MAQQRNTDSDLQLDEKYNNVHRMDNLNLLLYTFLIVLTVVTIWIFKYRRARYLHETGLAVIYGLIVGFLLHFTGTTEPVSHIRVIAENNTAYTEVLPPDVVLFKYMNSNSTQNRTYVYTFKGDIPETIETEMVQKVTFDPEIFFNILLPPIIFNAGYSLKRRHFFRNLGAIFTFAFVGTTLSALTIGGFLYGIMWVFGSAVTFIDCLLFGALISATDPVTVLAIFTDMRVDVDLYALVFGESILNDAVAIVLTGAIESYGGARGGFEGIAFVSAIMNFLWTFSMSFLIGSSMGCVTSVVTKFTRLRDFPLLETALFVLMSYSSFLMAEAAQLSGIVAVLFCGMCQAHYTYNNLSGDSRVASKSLFELLNFLSENFIFCYIGVSMFTFSHHKWEAGFICTSIVAVILGRAINIYPLSLLLNIKRRPKIPAKFMHMLFFSGLRGAMAFALAIRNTSSDSRKAILTTTSLIVIITVILCGGLTTQALNFLGISVDNNEEETLYLNSLQRNGSQDTELEDQAELANMHGVPHDETLSQRNEKVWLFRVWHKFDVRFMKPFLTNSRPTLLDTMPLCCAPIARLLTTTVQLSQDQEYLHDDMPISISTTVASNYSDANRQRPMVSSRSSHDGDLGVGTESLVKTSVSVEGRRGHQL